MSSSPSSPAPARVFDPGFDIRPTYEPLGFEYGEGVFGPKPELRTLEAIRPSLKDPACDGPEVLYAIAMDTGRAADRTAMVDRNLLFGAVTYARGRLGREPVRSQGHVHAVSASCGMSTCELYEIWSGAAYIYMQETDHDDPGRCYAIFAEPGDVVIVPPGWAHATIVGDVSHNLTFGAWCVRDFGFDYSGVRAHGGIAWFPEVDDQGATMFVANPTYRSSDIEVRRPGDYARFGLERGVPIYEQFTRDPDRMIFVSRPQDFPQLWQDFRP